MGPEDLVRGGRATGEAAVVLPFGKHRALIPISFSLHTSIGFLCPTHIVQERFCG